MKHEKIDVLTDAQVALLADVRDEWLSVGLATEPADRPAAEDGVRAAYRRAGLTPPRVMVWLDSPLAGCIGAAVLGQAEDKVRDQVGDKVWDQVWAQVGAKVGDKVWDQVWDQVGDQVRAQVGAKVGDQVWAQVRDQVGAQVWDQVWDQVGAQVGDQVGAQVWDQVWDQVGAQVGAKVGDQVWAQVWDQVGDRVWDAVQGQHDAGFLGWCDALRRIGVTIDVDGLSTVARNAGWWWPMRDAVILTDRPDTLHRDPQGRLHCTTGPALRYRDGWSIYAIHGERVPDHIETTP